MVYWAQETEKGSDPMPFEIVRNDITNMQVDAIVNTANPRPVIGSGTDAAVHAKAGPMLMVRKCIGDLETGSAVITPGFRLPAKYVIHTVGPVWEDGSRGEKKLLRQCYLSSLELARKKRLKSIAFPLVSSGNYGFPKALALEIATGAIREFLEENEMDVYLVVFSRESVRLSAVLQKEIRSFIDERYVRETAAKEYSFSVRADYEPVRNLMEPEEEYEDASEEDFDDRVYASEPDPDYRPADEFDRDLDWWDIPQFQGREDRNTVYPGASAPETAPMPEKRPAPKKAPKAAAPRPAVPMPSLSLAEMLKEQDAGFSDTLLKLIDRTGKKDSEIYRKANVSRQHFSKIRNNPRYQPTKSTALAFAIALELDLEQTKDLIGRAGFALTRSSKADLIIMYFIEKRNYDIIAINTALFEFDQSLLGA